jgi:hypothetical protein
MKVLIVWAISLTHKFTGNFNLPVEIAGIEMDFKELLVMTSKMLLTEALSCFSSVELSALFWYLGPTV